MILSYLKNRRCRHPKACAILITVGMILFSSVLLPSNVFAADSSDSKCADGGGAASLGWIVCPILDWMGRGADMLYTDLVEKKLQVEPQLLSQKDDEGTMSAWKTFQGFANICFIVFLLVVIFSQLTGVGIDNYGIKKILPKLIIAAILTNLSYVICMACVDLSNILGNSLKALFDNIDVGTPTLSVADSTLDAGKTIGATTLTGIGILIALVGMGGAVWANPGILLSLLVGALGAVISVLFLFILLATRQAAIIVLIVISPMAFVCYMLPNTKSLFDKWIKFFRGLLLVYPIAGLLVGGGDFVSRLMLTSGYAKTGFAAGLTAMIAGILPIFFIPTVLKSSIAAMGSLGSKIAGAGRGLSDRAKRNMRGSEMYRGLRARSLKRKTRIGAGYDRHGNKIDFDNKRFGKVRQLMRGGRTNINRNALQYQRDVAERGSLEAAEGEDFMLQTETANEAKRITAKGEVNDNNALSEGLEGALISGNKAKIRAYTDALSAKGEDGRKFVRETYDKAVKSGKVSGDAAKAFANNILTNHAADYKNNDRAMFSVAQNINSGKYSNGALETVEGFESNAENRRELAKKFTSTTIGNCDDGVFTSIFGSGDNTKIPDGMDEADAKAVGEMAYNALHDQNANLKADRIASLNKIVEASGYEPPNAKVEVVGGNAPAAGGGSAESGSFDVQNAGNNGGSNEGSFTVHGGNIPPTTRATESNDNNPAARVERNVDFGDGAMGGEE